jgi:anaerobic selenocysteine-containing dehydrogenase
MAMGFADPELLESDAAMIANLLAQTGTGINFAQLAAQGTMDFTPEPVIQFADYKFATPSGKIEIASEQFVAAGLPRSPQPFADDRPANGRLRVLSPASPWLMNSVYGNDTRVHKLIGEADVMLNPQETQQRGLEDGAKVVLSNQTGQLPLKVKFSDQVPCGVALVYKGRWPKLEPAHANVNVLNPGHKADIAESSCVHAIEVDITPIAASKS